MNEIETLLQFILPVSYVHMWHKTVNKLEELMYTLAILYLIGYVISNPSNDNNTVYIVYIYTYIYNIHSFI